MSNKPFVWFPNTTKFHWEAQFVIIHGRILYHMKARFQRFQRFQKGVFMVMP